MSASPPAAPELPAHAALLLDLDGTLIDFAPTPDAVVVPPGLIDTLAGLRDRLGGALAVVTGRPIADVDALLGDAPTAVAGEHGAAVRHRPGEAVERMALPALRPDWIGAAEAAAAAHPGALLERKEGSLVLHFRRAPEAGPALHAVFAALLPDAPGFVIMQAAMAWEFKPRGADKGRAVAALMDRPPFRGRLPVYIGDDITDEDGMRAARALGGFGWRVQEFFGTPAGVRAWLGAVRKEG